ncbi:hypothetical protein [Hoylesella shahii]|jgi:hypothetical protein|uniref:hypothetical protein n=1 Tax=Hoylesella shahii TaxID=228603 RepID=UPI00248D9EB7|nr:hypothetical protein [Hoylesella shahii]
MIEKNWLTLNEEKNKEIATLLSKVFGEDIEECMCDFQLTFEKFRGMKLTNSSHIRPNGEPPYSHKDIEWVAARAVGVFYHIVTLCGFDFANLLLNGIERIENNMYKPENRPSNNILNSQSYCLEYAQNGVIVKDEQTREVNVFEFEESISKALSIRSVREKLGALIMSDIEYIVNEDDGNKYKVEVVIKKEDC